MAIYKSSSAWQDHTSFRSPRRPIIANRFLDGNQEGVGARDATARLRCEAALANPVRIINKPERESRDCSTKQLVLNTAVALSPPVSPVPGIAIRIEPRNIPVKRLFEQAPPELRMLKCLRKLGRESSSGSRKAHRGRMLRVIAQDRRPGPGRAMCEASFSSYRPPGARFLSRSRFYKDSGPVAGLPNPGVSARFKFPEVNCYGRLLQKPENLAPRESLN
jgi:hypothetical protein